MPGRRRCRACHRRAHWHIVHHLCATAPAGAPFGALVGVTRQALLLDESTVRDRVAEMAEAGDCALEPPSSPIAARTLMTASPALRAGHDATLAALRAALARHAGDLQPGLRLTAATELDAAGRTLALDAVIALTDGWTALLGNVFETLGLSSARQLEARRNLLSTSHRTLLLGVLAHACQQAAPPLLADQLAAGLLQRTGQNFQTTRDHIAYLLTIGVLARAPGRSLSITLAPACALPMRTALAALESRLAQLVRRDGLPDAGSYALRIAAPGEPARTIVMARWPFTIGRTEATTLRLASADISRAHCSISIRNGQAVIEDTGSTNGTIVDGTRIAAAVPLRDGAEIRVGPFALTFLAPCETSDATVRILRSRA